MSRTILFIGMNGDPPTTGYATRVLAILHTLKNAGYKVVFLRFYPAFKATHSWRSTLALSGIALREVPTLPFARFALLRALSFAFANIALHIYAKIIGAHAIQAESNDAAMAVLCRQWTRIPVLVDFHGAAAEEGSFAALTTAPQPQDWKNHAEKLALHKASRCFVVAPNMIEHLTQKHGMSVAHQCVIVPVNVDAAFFTPSIHLHRMQVRRQLGIENHEILLAYCGGAQAYQCLDEMVALFTQLAPLLPVKLLIISQDSAAFSNKFAQFGSRIVYRSATHKEVPALLAAADVGLLLRNKHILNIVSCPTKAGEYLACGLPIITTDWAGHAPDLVTRFAVGLIIDAAAPAIDDLIAFLRNRPTAEHCQTIAQLHLRWESSAKNIEHTYSTLLSLQG